MISNKRFLIYNGIIILSSLAVASILHFILKVDTFFLTLTYLGLWFYSEYHYQVIMMPLTRSIGRLEGECIILDKEITRRKLKCNKKPTKK